MKKRALFTVSLVLSALLLSGCCLSHEWTDATCETPKTCAKCGETEGEALGHSWSAATCLIPETCSICQKTQGEALGHSWEDATCETPKTCSACSAAEGDPLGHTVMQGVIEVDPETQEASYVGVCGVCEASDARIVYSSLSELGETWTQAKWLPMLVAMNDEFYNFAEDMQDDYFLFDANNHVEFLLEGQPFEGTWTFYENTAADYDYEMLEYLISTDSGILRYYMTAPDLLMWESNGLLFMYTLESALATEE